MARAEDAPSYTIAPGPGGHPIADQLRPFERNPLRFLEDMHRDYGDIVRLHLWPQLYHLVSHPDGVKHVLTTHRDNYHWTPPVASSQMVPGEEAATFDPASALRRMGRLAHAISRRDTLNKAATTMHAAVMSMFTRWQGHIASGEPLDVAPELVRLALTIVGDALLATDLRSDLDALVPAMASHLKHSAPQWSVSSYQTLEQPAPSSDVVGATRTVIDLVNRLIDERRRAGRRGDDCLSMLLFDPDETTGERFGSAELREVIRVLLVAGHSAVSDAVGWTLYALAEHPEAQHRVQTEVDTVLGSRVPRAADLPKLRYTWMVLQEAMRLYPPVWMFAPRMAVRDDTIAGFRIPAGSLILMSPWVFHRSPSFWERPEEFDPERFAGPLPAAYYPFGAGPWGCLGSQFGTLEARLVVAMIAQRYRWRLTPGHSIEPDPQLSLRPRHGMPLLLRQRMTGDA